MRNVVVLSFTALALSACGMFGSDKIDLTESKDVNSAIEAATGPLQDLNLRRQEIPAILVSAANSPYGHKKMVKCDDIKTEVSQLDTLLGPDMVSNDMTYASANENLVDHISNVSSDIGDSLGSSSDSKDTAHNGIEMPDRATLMDSAGSMVRDKLMDTITGQTNILPFRSIIRKISGAESHQRKLATAYEAGKLRRAYLKGLAEDRFGPKCLAKPIIVQATSASVEAKADVPSTPLGFAH